MLSRLFHQFQCSTMMLSEHVEAITEHRRKKKKNEDLYVPEVDQQQLEEWEWLLKRSLEKNSSVRVTYLLNNRRNTVIGIVEIINTNKRLILLRTTNEIKTISPDTVIEVAEG